MQKNYKSKSIGNQFEAHPYCQLFPDITGDEFRELKDGIARNGQLDPVILHEGKILDGKNIARACWGLNIEPVTQEWKGECGTPLQYVITKNVHRRHLNESQRAFIALRLMPLLEEEAKARRNTKLKQNQNEAAKTDGASLPGRSRDQVGELLNVSGRLIQDAKHIQENAPKYEPKIMAAKTKIGTVLKKIKKSATAKEKEAAKKYQQSQGLKDIEVIEGDMHLVLPSLKRGTIDCIITDPPYKDVDAYEKTARLFAQAQDFKNGGFVIVFVGKSHYWEVYDAMSEYLNPYPHLTAPAEGPTQLLYDLNMVSADTSLQVYYKGDFQEPPATVISLIRGSKREKDFHPWQQSLHLTQRLVYCFTKPGDLIVDPFCGSGTTLLAAYREGRKAIGIDKDPRAVIKTQARLQWENEKGELGPIRDRSSVDLPKMISVIDEIYNSFKNVDYRDAIVGGLALNISQE